MHEVFLILTGALTFVAIKGKEKFTNTCLLSSERKYVCIVQGCRDCGKYMFQNFFEVELFCLSCISNSSEYATEFSGKRDRYCLLQLVLKLRCFTSG